jgi:hypothetical protein
VEPCKCATCRSRHRMESMMREGWEAVVIPTRALYAGFVSRTAWGRRAFGIFEHDFVHEDAGDTSVTFLFHQQTGCRLAVFMGPELAMEGVALIEDAADWDQVLKNAKDLDDAIRLFHNAIGNRWNHFIAFEWVFDRMHALTRPMTAEEVARDRIAVPTSPDV